MLMFANLCFGKPVRPHDEIHYYKSQITSQQTIFYSPIPRMYIFSIVLICISLSLVMFSMFDFSKPFLWDN